MSRDDPEARAQQIQAIFDELVDQRLDASLKVLDEALAGWRESGCNPLEAHRQVMCHVARADALATAVSSPTGESLARLLRAAVDAAIIDRNDFIEILGHNPEDVEPHELETAVRLQLPEKKQVINRLLEEGPILVHIDARRDGVKVPEHLSDDPCLVLRYGFDLSPAIVDLDVGEESMSGTLTFAGEPFCCVLPWTAVYAAVSEADQRGMVWPDDVPPEAVKSIGGDADDEAARPSAEAPEKRPSHLKLVD